MATCRRCSTSMTNNAAARLCVMAALLALGSVAGSEKARDFCPTGDLVYPYWSMCFNPATYDEEYTIVSLSITPGLAPEWDESNSTYYVRLSEEPAIYKLAYESGTTGSSVSQGDDFTIVNVDAGRSLAWRQEGDEYFLIESESDAATFQWLKDETAALPCPLVYGSRCEAYNLLSGGSNSGLSAYLEDSVTYFKQQSSDLKSFLLIRDSSRSMARPRSQNVITSVV